MAAASASTSAAAASTSRSSRPNRLSRPGRRPPTRCASSPSASAMKAGGATSASSASASSAPSTKRPWSARPAPCRCPKSSPWLFNGTLSILAGRDLVFYAGYSKGLEESPVAPDDRGQSRRSAARHHHRADGRRLPLRHHPGAAPGRGRVRRAQTLFRARSRRGSSASSAKCATAASRCRSPARSRRGSASSSAPSSSTRR